MLDDLGAEVQVRRQPNRVVSLVPSLTEALAVTLPGALVGATDWCSKPTDLEVARVRGPKNPDRDLIINLSPDLVIANVEENRRLDVERLRSAGIPVWVTRVESVSEAFTSLARMFWEAFELPEVGWLDEAKEIWRRPPKLTGRVAVPVWRDPWIWVGTSTYPDDVLRRLGLTNVIVEPRYPRLDAKGVLSRSPDFVLLPDEPYPFTFDNGPAAWATAQSRLVSGRALFWFGPEMARSREQLEAAFGEQTL